MTATTPSAGGGVSSFTLATGPLDEFDDEANGDPDSMNGEDDEAGFDEMPAELGWDEESDEDEDEDGTEDEDEE